MIPIANEIDLDRLRTIQSRERDTTELRPLDDEFYDAVASYVGDLAAERGDESEFSDEQQRIADELSTAKQVTEAIYERRVGKIVKLASLAASDVDVDRDAMTAEEREMFDELVEAIDRNHERIVGKVHEPFQTSLGGPSSAGADAETAPEGTASAEGAASAPDAGPAARDGAASAPADDDGREAGAEASAGAPGRPNDEPPDDGNAVASGPADASDASDTSGATADAGAHPERGEAGGGASATGREDAEEHGDPPEGFVRVRVVEDVPGFVGTDGVEYDPSPQDVLTLPEENAEALCSRDAAVTLDED